MASENDKDRWIPLAATCAAARHDVGFLHAALSAKTNTDAVRRRRSYRRRTLCTRQRGDQEIVKYLLSDLNDTAAADVVSRRSCCRLVEEQSGETGPKRHATSSSP